MDSCRDLLTTRHNLELLSAPAGESAPCPVLRPKVRVCMLGDPHHAWKVCAVYWLRRRRPSTPSSAEARRRRLNHTPSCYLSLSHVAISLPLAGDVVLCSCHRSRVSFGSTCLLYHATVVLGCGLWFMLECGLGIPYMLMVNYVSMLYHD